MACRCLIPSGINTEMIAANIKDEMRRLSHRKQLSYQPTAQTMQSSASGSNLLQPLNMNASVNPSGLLSSPVKGFSASGLTLGSDGSVQMGLLSPSKRDQPLFTSRQVGMICERILRDRENQLRTEYDTILGSKLAGKADSVS